MIKQKVSDKSGKLDNAPTQAKMDDPSYVGRGKPNYKVTWAESPSDLPRHSETLVDKPAYIANRWSEYR